jgi:hypothetical protein
VNFNQQQSRIAGISLIALGVVAIFNLWWIVPVGLLAGGGVYLYRQRKQMGRSREAVQFAFWGLGLAVLYLTDLIFPGVLILVGLSLLMRGREQDVEARVQRGLGRFNRRRSANAVNEQDQTALQATTMAAPVQQSARPAETAQEQPAVGETVRLQ